jgi:hypothetical protein
MGGNWMTLMVSFWFRDRKIPISWPDSPDIFGVKSYEMMTAEMALADLLPEGSPGDFG